jgi:signal transduction histidine kinase
VVGAALLAAAGSPAGATIQYTHAEVALQEAGILHPPDSGWQSAPLPLLRIFTRPEVRSMRWPSAWVRLEFALDAAPQRPWALYLTRHREQLRVLVNGVPVAQTFNDPAEKTMSWNRPVLIDLPQGLLQPGRNTVLLHLTTTTARALNLSRPLIGERDALQGRYELRRLAQVEGPRAISLLIGALGVFVFLLWLARPQERAFLWLAVAAVVWNLRNLHYFLNEAPFDYLRFMDMTILSHFVLMVAVYGFAVHFFALRQRWLLWLLVATAVLLSAVRLADLRLPGLPSDFLTYLLSVPVALVITFILARQTWRQPTVAHGLMLAAMVAAFAMGINDLMMMISALSPEGLYLQPYSALLLFSAFAYAIGERFVRSMREVEQVNLRLAEREAQVRRELEESNRRLRKAEAERAVEQERQRLMREIHDGVGSTLIASLAMVDRGELPQARVADALREAIDDLKLMVDSLEPTDQDLLALLAALRHRLEWRLESAGLRFDWQVRDLPPLPWLDPAKALTVLRILQEAITNVVKHARARTITVSTGTTQQAGIEHVIVTLVDDGKGFDPHATRRGRGVHNMVERAASIGGRCTVESTVTGTRVELLLPTRPPERLAAA